MSELKVTSAEDYARIETPKDETELVPMPSGAVFRMRRVDLQALALIGALPQSLLNTAFTAWKRQGKTEAVVEALTEKIGEQDSEETIRQLIIMRQIVVENVLAPRIGYDAGAVCLFNERGDAVAMMKHEDFTFAYRWITRREGIKAPGLETFREGPERGVAVDSVDDEEHGDASERTPETVEVVQ